MANASLYVKIGADITEFEKKMASVSTKVANVGKKITAAGKKMTLGFTVPLAALSTAAFKASTDINKSLGNVSTLLNGTTEQVTEKVNIMKNDLY